VGSDAQSSATRILLLALAMFGQTCVRFATPSQQSIEASFSFPVISFIRFSGDAGRWPRPRGQLSFDGPGVGVTLPVRCCHKLFYLA
jgi:hypothetical protein